MEFSSAWTERWCGVVGPRKTRLVDEVSDFGEKGFAQFDTRQGCIGRSAELTRKDIEDIAGEVGLLAEHAQESLAIHGAFIVAGEAACCADAERDGNSSSC
jgi:hypothetical protein